ncbi:hypothetical protein [Actinomadura chokoriensis]|uniref:hypothetical protein n=1 Tax=Actinomadura chokoriensis TaxID=454156 RepID=UPI0031FA2751
MNTNPTEPCAACAEPVDWSAGPHEFVRADGSTAVVCADCCGSIAEAMAPDEQGVHSVEALGDERASAVVDTPADVKGVHSVRTLGDERGVIAAETPADDDATAGKSATWPDGEPADVRDMARRHDLARRADDLAAMLSRDLGDVRDERLTVAVRATVEGLRALSAACPTADEDAILRAAEHAHTALVRCADLVAEIERGDA